MERGKLETAMSGGHRLGQPLYLLDIYESGHRIDTRPLPAGDYTIGRHESCEICFDHDAVSRMHAKLHVASGAVSIEDLGSANGLLIKGERVNEAGLLPGMRVGVPPFELELRPIESEELDADTVISAKLDEATRILAPPSVQLRLVAGSAPQSTYALKFGRTAVGRGDDCEIRLPEDFVSRRHAVFELGYDSLVIKDQGSTVGTFVDSQRVDEKELGLGDRVLIGKAVFEIESCEGVALPTAHTRTSFPAQGAPRPLDTGVLQAVRDDQKATSQPPNTVTAQTSIGEEPTAALHVGPNISAFASSPGQAAPSFDFGEPPSAFDLREPTTVPATSKLQPDARPTAAAHFPSFGTDPGDLPSTFTPTAVQSVDVHTPLSPTAPGSPAPVQADPPVPVTAELDAETRLQAAPEPSPPRVSPGASLAMPAGLIDGDAIISSLSGPSAGELSSLDAVALDAAPPQPSSRLLFVGVVAGLLVLIAAGGGSWYAWKQLGSDRPVAVVAGLVEGSADQPADPPGESNGAQQQIKKATDESIDDGSDEDKNAAPPKAQAHTDPDESPSPPLDLAHKPAPQDPGAQPAELAKPEPATPSKPQVSPTTRLAHAKKRRGGSKKKASRSPRKSAPSRRHRSRTRSANSGAAPAPPPPPPPDMNTQEAPTALPPAGQSTAAQASQVEQLFDDGLIDLQLGHADLACRKWQQALKISAADHPLKKDLQRKLAQSCGE